MEIKDLGFRGFAHALGHVQGYLFMALEDDEKMVEFAARGIQKADLKNLSEGCQKVARAFYEKPQPH